MGECDICGKSAGLLRDAHEACEAGKSEMMDIAEWSAKTGTPPYAEARAKVEAIASGLGMPYEEVEDALYSGWMYAVDEVLADKVLTPEEEARAIAIRDAFGLSRDSAVGDTFSRAARNARRNPDRSTKRPPPRSP